MKGIFIPLLIFFSITANAQSYYIVGGINTSILGDPKDIIEGNLSRTYSPGFQLGPSVNFKIGKHFSINPGLFFSLKTEETEYAVLIDSPEPFDDILMEKSSSLKKYYIDFPLSIKFRYPLSTAEIICFAGPYINLLAFDKTVTKIYFDGAYVPDPGEPMQEKFSNRLDYGASLGIGFEYRSHLVQLSIDRGFYREMKYKNHEMDERYRNIVFRLNLAYKLFGV